MTDDPDQPPRGKTVPPAAKADVFPSSWFDVGLIALVLALLVVSIALDLAQTKPNETFTP